MGPLAGAGVLAMGVGIDVDHLVDHAWTAWRGERSHFFAPLHGWELATLALAVGIAMRRRAAGPLVVGVAIGWWVHLIQDTVSNRPAHLGAYSLAYRIRHRFGREITGWGDHTNFHGWSGKPWYTWF
jgi:hypothetical protein